MSFTIKKALVLPRGSSMCLRAMSRAGFSSVAVFPLTYRLHIAGCFVLARQGGPSPFQFTDLAQATLFGNILSDIFERFRLIEVVKRQHKARRQVKREHERLHSLTASSLSIVPDTLDTIMEKETSVP